jgi:hypothetical protein
LLSPNLDRNDTDETGRKNAGLRSKTGARAVVSNPFQLEVHCAEAEGRAAEGRSQSMPGESIIRDIRLYAPPHVDDARDDRRVLRAGVQTISADGHRRADLGEGVDSLRAFLTHDRKAIALMT